MNALQAAQRIYDSTIRQLADTEQKLELDAVMLEIATFCATLAQAEASRPRWVQIGDTAINLSLVAYIELKSKDWDDKPVCKVKFAATEPNGDMVIWFGGEDYEPAVIQLSNALHGCMVESAENAK